MPPFPPLKVARSAVLLLGLVVFSAAAYAATPPPGSYILECRPGVAVADVANHYGMRVLRQVPNRPIFLVQTLTGTFDDAWEADLEGDPGVASVERVMDVVSGEAPPGASLNSSTGPLGQALGNRTLVSFYGVSAWYGYVNQPASTIVKLPNVRSLATGAGTVAIIDTGVDPNHPLLRSSLVAGYDFVREVAGSASEMLDLDPTTANVMARPNSMTDVQPSMVNQSTSALLDQSTSALLDTSRVPAAFGHGTMVAGIIHLVAPAARLMPLKAFKGDGTSNSFDILRAIYFAADSGAKVINMSFSLAAPSREVMRAVNYATDLGTICIASAGNSGQQAPLVHPAALRSVIAVAATTNNDVRSAFSNFGSSLVHVAAPGEAVVSTYPGGRYAAAWGTSFAAPFVTGGAALLAQTDTSTNQFRAAEDLGQAQVLPGGLGFGRLDLYRAVTKRTRSGNSGPGGGGN